MRYYLLLIISLVKLVVWMGVSFRCVEYSDVFWIMLKFFVYCVEIGMCKFVL